MTTPIKGKLTGPPIEGLGRVVDAPLVFGKRALEPAHLMKLAEGLALGFPDRIFGTETGRKSAEWLAKELRRAGCEPGVGRSFLQEFRYPIGDERWPGQNVVGLLRGTDPKLRDEYVIVSAHHDSQEGTLLGSNDNASGCALVLALAQAFAKNPPKRSILFVTFDGEEALKFQGKNQPGRRGSKVYAEDPVVPLNKTALMVNADMIGQPHLESGPRNEVYQWSSRDHFAKGVLARAAAKATAQGDVAVDGYPEQHPQAQMFTTDAEPLYRVGVPIVNFLSGRDLDNHQVADDMHRLIPERMAQYARLAYECVVEAANHEQSLAEMKIQPGSYMPSYPLVKHLKSAGASVIEEEALRLSDLSARLPQLRDAGRRLVRALESEAITRRAGVDWKALRGDEVSLAKEPVLHRVRELKAGLLDEYHQIPKGEVARRRPLQDRLAALNGVEDILQGAIYLNKLKNKGDYYLQQIPPRLGELLRGAQTLGLDAKLDGIVLQKDAVAFSAKVNADRAVFVARDTVWGLGQAINGAAAGILNAGKSVSAFRDPSVYAEDLDALKGKLMAAGEALLGGDPNAGKRSALVRAILSQHLRGLNKGGAKWIEEFQDRNSLEDFAGLIPALKVPAPDEAELLRKAQALQDNLQKAGAGVAIVQFYGALTELAFGPGGKARDIEDLRRLGTYKGLEAAFEQAEKARGEAKALAAQAAAANAPELAQLSALAEVVGSALRLNRSFDRFKGFLLPEVSLTDLEQQVIAVRDAFAKIPGTEDARTELDFWVRWLGEYRPYEAEARAQAKQREGAAERLGLAVSRLWPAIVEALGEHLPVHEDDRDSPSKVRRAVELLLLNPEKLEKKPELGATLEVLLPYFELESAARELKRQPSPKAEATVAAAVPKLKEMLGREALFAVNRALGELAEARGEANLVLKQKERGAPLAVSALGAPERGVE